MIDSIMELKEALENLVKEVEGCELDDNQRKAIFKAKQALINYHLKTK